MFSSWGWLRNLGLVTMVGAVTLWFTAPSNTYTWITALLLWLFGCVLVSAAGLALLCQVPKRRPQPAVPAQTKIKPAAA
jgi:hypothetical protein